MNSLTLIRRFRIWSIASLSLCNCCLQYTLDLHWQKASRCLAIELSNEICQILKIAAACLIVQRSLLQSIADAAQLRQFVDKLYYNKSADAGTDDNDSDREEISHKQILETVLAVLSTAGKCIVWPFL